MPSCLLCLPVSQRGVPALLSSQVMPWVASPRSGPHLQSRGAGRPGIKQRGRVLGSFSSLAAAEQSHVPTRGGRGCWRAAPQPPSASRPRCPRLPWARGRWRRCALHLDSCRAHTHGLLSGRGTTEAWRSWSEVLGCCWEGQRLDCKPLHCPEAPCWGLSSQGGGVVHPASPGPALGRWGTVPSCRLTRGRAGAAVITRLAARILGEEWASVPITTSRPEICRASTHVDLSPPPTSPPPASCRLAEGVPRQPGSSPGRLPARCVTWGRGLPLWASAPSRL